MSKALNELRKATMASYLAKAGRSVRTNAKLGSEFEGDMYKNMADANKHHPNVVTPGFEKDPEKLAKAQMGMKINKDLADKFKHTSDKRIKGIARAGRLLAKEEKDSATEKKTTEEVEQLAGSNTDIGVSKIVEVAKIRLRNNINEKSRDSSGTARYGSSHPSRGIQSGSGPVDTSYDAMYNAPKNTAEKGEIKAQTPSERYQAALRAKKVKRERDYASGKGMRGYGDDPKGAVSYANDPRNVAKKKIGE